MKLISRARRYHIFIISLVAIYMFFIFCVSAVTGNETYNNEFNGEIIFDRAAGGFHIFKINGAYPYREIQLTKKEPDNYEPRWSPDGKYIVYINRKKSETSNIFIMDFNGNNKRKITSMENGIIFNIHWAKDGNEVHFAYNPNKPRSEIIEKAVDIRTGTMRNIEKTEEKFNECDRTIQSPNEERLICTKLLISGKERLSIYQKEKDERTVINRIAAKFKKDQKIFSYKGIDYQKKTEMILEDIADLLWSKDSLRFAALIGSKLAIFDKDGHEIIRKALCKDEGATCLRAWHQDPKKILYSCYCGAQEIQERIYLFDLETKKSLYIKEGQNPDWYSGAK